MPTETQYVDANVLLAYALDEEGRAPVVEQVLREAEEGKRRLLSSTVSVVEVAFGAEKAKSSALDPGTLSTIDNLWSGGEPVALAEASTRMMYLARDLARAARGQGWRLTPRDAIHLATAVSHQVDVLYTYEGAAQRWSQLGGIPVEEPSVKSLPLF